jgi:ribonuclease P protein component
MLKKINRLTKEKDFQAVYRRGRYFQTAFFSVNFLPAKNQTRIGIIISKKISKKAVERNHAKRQTRSMAEALLPKINKPADIVISIKRPFLDSDFKSLEKDLNNIFSKLGLI